MLKTRIAVLVSGGGTNLQALIDAERAGRIPHGEIALVLSNRESAYGLTRAREAGVPAEVVTRAEGDFEGRITARLEAHGIQMVILAGFMCILDRSFTDRWAGRIINIHPSLIPSFCGEGFYGLHVHEAALARGVKWTGATVHYVNEIADGGEIILQKPVEVLTGDTPEVLQRRVMEQAEWVILPQAAELVAGQLLQEENGND